MPDRITSYRLRRLVPRVLRFLSLDTEFSIVLLFYRAVGARDFSSAVSGFCMCRPSANTENSRRTRVKPLLPRVILPQLLSWLLRSMATLCEKRNQDKLDWKSAKVSMWKKKNPSTLAYRREPDDCSDPCLPSVNYFTWPIYINELPNDRINTKNLREINN